MRAEELFVIRLWLRFTTARKEVTATNNKQSIC
jgi:hypothetical protein